MLGLYLLSFPIVIYFSSFCLPVELSGIKKIILFSYLLIYFWLCWVFVAAQAFFFFFSSSGKWGSLSTCRVLASHCSGFSCGAQALEPVGFSSCGTWAQ